MYRKHAHKESAKVLALFLAIPLFIILQMSNIPCMTMPVAENTNTFSLDDTEIVRAQSMHLINIPITAVVRVKRILDDDNIGLPHQKFLIGLSNGSTVLIAHNTRLAPRVPIRVGDLVTIHGDYVWNRKGGIVHWTHHSDSFKHSGGWIEHAGKRYE